MNIEEYIKQQKLEPLLHAKQVLIVYDPDQRYQEICLSMAQDTTIVVDTTESSIISRAAALDALSKIGTKEVDELLVYVPAHPPLTDEQKQIDPFSIYAECGAIFPDPKKDSDSFLSICLTAKPDYAAQIRNIFKEDSSPSFAVIDAIGGGDSWPNLKSLLNTDSANDIILALLHPNDMQEAALSNSDKDPQIWISEAKRLLKAIIGLKLKTRSKSWSVISDELWRYVLFSEFVFDLPESLPFKLEDVARADDNALPTIETICARLRNDIRTRDIYIDKAQEVERDLGLAAICQSISDLGVKDTFPFEERTFLSTAISAMQRHDMRAARDIISRQSNSVWMSRGESQLQWDLLRSALTLLESCTEYEGMIPSKARNMDQLIELYTSHLREVDRLHREFEQAVTLCSGQDFEEITKPIQAQARQRYGKLMEKVQSLFTQYLQNEGWPVLGYLPNTDVFDKLVAPKLQQNGYKVAYLMVDALRYEMGMALKKQIENEGAVEITTALAQLPSITLVGMASLLPGASTGFRLEKSGKDIVPYIDDQEVKTVEQRMNLVKKRYGQRFDEGRLEKYARGTGKKVDENVELFILRSVEIDSQFENHPETAPDAVTSALKNIRTAILKLKAVGFNEVVIVTDHGFFMNTHAEAGDTCNKPQGDWKVIHERCVLGEGDSDLHHYHLSSEQAGIKGDFKQVAGPLSFATYKSGMLYYHGGASLQECVVPVITVKLDGSKDSQVSVEKFKVAINYKNGAKRITTRMPVVALTLQTEDMFSVDAQVEVLLEAHNKKGEVVGEAKTGGLVNTATGTIMMTPDNEQKITVKMDMEFEGKFILKAFNPSTMAVYEQIELETDYTV